MARIRTIKPEFFRHEALFEAEKETGLPLRVAFAGLWTACDREGRFRWSPRALKLDCLPYDDVDFSRVLDALTTRGFIVKYACDGDEYGAVPSFLDHQVINNREKSSSIPKPPENIEELTRAPRVPHACPTPLEHAQGEGKGREGKGKDIGAAPQEEDFPENEIKEDYAFVGKVIKLKNDDFVKWSKVYDSIPDLKAELAAADDYYSENPPKDGKWFFPVSNWLKKSHTKHKEEKAEKFKAGPHNDWTDGNGKYDRKAHMRWLGVYE